MNGASTYDEAAVHRVALYNLSRQIQLKRRMKPVLEDNLDYDTHLPCRYNTMYQSNWHPIPAWDKMTLSTTHLRQVNDSCGTLEVAGKFGKFGKCLD